MIDKMKMPKVVEHEDATATETYGKFIAQPLERGYGVTIGNMLRRVLLSSLPGMAISGIKVKNVLHEFSVIEGVKEDVVEIVLNLKRARFKSLSKKDTIVNVTIDGPAEFTAGDIVSLDGDFEVINPKHKIATLSEGAVLNMDIYISRGRGYESGEEQPMDKKPIGYIGVDAIYTPIKNVRYMVENTRLEKRTDYEKLILEVDTDGTVNPNDAVSMAAKTIIDHTELFRQFSMEGYQEYEEIVEGPDEEFERTKAILGTRIEDLELSVRSHNCLRSAQIEVLWQLVLKTEDEVARLKNFGKKSLAELKQVVESKGLHFGMDVSQYQIKD